MTERGMTPGFCQKILFHRRNSKHLPSQILLNGQRQLEMVTLGDEKFMGDNHYLKSQLEKYWELMQILPNRERAP